MIYLLTTFDDFGPNLLTNISAANQGFNTSGSADLCSHIRSCAKGSPAHHGCKANTSTLVNGAVISKRYGKYPPSKSHSTHDVYSGIT